jgi:hypothetical protein
VALRELRDAIVSEQLHAARGRASVAEQGHALRAAVRRCEAWQGRLDAAVEARDTKLALVAGERVRQATGAIARMTDDLRRLQSELARSRDPEETRTTYERELRDVRRLGFPVDDLALPPAPDSDSVSARVAERFAEDDLFDALEDDGREAFDASLLDSVLPDRRRSVPN